MRTPASRIACEVHDGGQVVDVVAEEVVLLQVADRSASGASPRRASRRAARSPAPAIHFVASVSAGPPFGGLYLKPPSWGGLCEGVITMPSAMPEARLWLWARIACDTAGVGVNPPAASTSVVDVVRDEDLDAGVPGRLGERVRVGPDEQRPVRALPGAVLDDRLGGGGDVVVVERGRERRAPVARGAERDRLQRVRRIRMALVVGPEELLDVDEVRRRRRAAGSGIGRHCHVSSARSDSWRRRVERTCGCCSTPCHPAPTLRSVEPVAHGPHHRSGDAGRPEMGWIDAAMRARTVSRPLLIARPFRLCPRGQHSMRIRTVLCATALATVAAFPLAGVASAHATHRPRLPRLRQPGRGAVGAALALRRPAAPGLRPQRHRLRGVLQDGPARGAEAPTASRGRRRPRSPSSTATRGRASSPRRPGPRSARP